jgi:hypothetical protein
MKKTISESMNTQRSKTKGSVVDVSENGKPDHAPYLAFGALSVAYGVSVFVFLPLALLNFNLGLMLTLFFMILLGMILGLSMLATNIQPLLENLIVKTLLAWETVATKQLILKNLTVHRPNNK